MARLRASAAEDRARPADGPEAPHRPVRPQSRAGKPALNPAGAAPHVQGGTGGDTGRISLGTALPKQPAEQDDISSLPSKEALSQTCTHQSSRGSGGGRSSRCVTPWLCTHASFQSSRSPFQQFDGSFTAKSSLIKPALAGSQGPDLEPGKALGTFPCRQLCRQACSSLPPRPAASSASSPAWPRFQNSFMHTFSLTHARKKPKKTNMLQSLQSGLQLH